MKRQSIIVLALSIITCLGLYQIYSSQQEGLKHISRIQPKGATTPDSGIVTTDRAMSDMPLVHVGPQITKKINPGTISDDAFSVPVPTPVIKEDEIENTASEIIEPASPWDALAKGDIRLQMISYIQGHRYAVINGLSVKKGDTVMVRVSGNKNILLKVTNVQRNKVVLTLDNIARSITLT